MQYCFRAFQDKQYKAKAYPEEHTTPLHGLRTMVVCNGGVGAGAELRVANFDLFESNKKLSHAELRVVRLHYP